MIRTSLSISVLLILSVIFGPLSASAANDVTLTTTAVIGVNGTTLGITESGTNDKIIVSGNGFTVTMSNGSSLKVKSGARRKLSVSPDNMLVSQTCTSDESSVYVGSPPTATPVAVTVEVSSNTCSGTGSSSGSTGGGVVGVTTGSGGASPTLSPVPVIPLTPSPVRPITAEQAQKIILAATTALHSSPGSSTQTPGGSMMSAVFTKNLGVGATNADVKRLQELLNSDPETQIANSGIGSPGNETSYYGALTVTAVQKFQKKYGLVSDGTPATTGFGALGPKTRTAIEMYLGKSMPPQAPAPPATPAPTPTLAPGAMETPTPTMVSASLMVHLETALSKGKTHSDVKALQQVLNSDPDTQIVSSGVGSSGNETDYYGGLTEKAVQKFQEKYGLAKAGDPGYGSVGPKTRAKINELYGHSGGSVPQTVGPPTPSLPPPAPSTASSDDAAKAALEKQIQDALQKIKAISAQIQKTP